VEGSFLASDGVEIVGSDGVAFAKGLTQMSATDLRAVAGQRTGDLPDGMLHEVVHRDDLVIVP
jgi:glutamate 5-kinase